MFWTNCIVFPPTLSKSPSPPSGLTLAPLGKFKSSGPRSPTIANPSEIIFPPLANSGILGTVGRFTPGALFNLRIALFTPLINRLSARIPTLSAPLMPLTTPFQIPLMLPARLRKADWTLFLILFAAFPTVFLSEFQTPVTVLRMELKTELADDLMEFHAPLNVDLSPFHTELASDLIAFQTPDNSDLIPFQTLDVTDLIAFQFFVTNDL